MANRKISDLTALTAPATGDLLPIVDISEAAAADKNKKITYGELLSSAPAGSAAAPSFSFDGDPNSGLYSAGADQVAISTGGSGRLFVDASGRVGVGATPAAANFEVSQSGTASASDVLRIYNRTDGTSTGYLGLPKYGSTASAYGPYSANNVGINAVFTQLNIGTETAHALVAYTNNTEKLRITASGAVGVGTSSPSDYESGKNNLVIANTGGSAGLTVASSTTGYGEIAFADGTVGNQKYRGQITYDHTNDRLQLYSAATTAVTIDSSQRVGIGTSSPTHNLTIGNTAPSDFVLSLRGGFGGFLGWDDSANCTILQAPNTRSLQFRVNSDTFSAGTMAMHINSSGNVGIGTTSPSRTLDVVGTGIYTAFTGNTGATFNIVPGANGQDGVSLIHSYQSGTGYGPLKFEINGEKARIDSSGRLLVGTSSSVGTANGFTPSVQVAGTSTLAAISAGRYAANANPPQITLQKSRSGTIGSQTVVVSGDEVGQISFEGSDGTAFRVAANITAAVDGTPGANDMPGRLVFSTTADGASSPTERMRITSIGTLSLNDGSNNLGGTKRLLHMGIDGSLEWGMVVRMRNTTGVTILRNYNSSDVFVGGITVDTTSTSFSTSSDYRLKENVVALTGAIDRVNQLRVCRFNFIAEPSKTVDGFLAHEAQAVVPECVTGEKDAVDADGNPIYQGIDQSKLVPLLTAALQEAVAEIKALKDRVTALEGA